MSSKTKHRERDKPRRQDNGIETKNLAPVNEAVKEYRVIEDGAYAYHLQNEEIENHYSQNVNMRRTVMDDIRRAKELQDEEDRKAKIMTLDEEREIKEMDEELAEFIQEEIYHESALEEKQRKEREERDQELAMLLEEKERRRVETSKKAAEQDHAIASRLQNLNVTPSPPGSRDERRIRLMTDEELAKRLQEEEKLKVERTKKRKQELKSVVEMQDEELAKYIHDREVEAAEMRFRKEKGKRKSKKKGEPLYYDDNVHPPVYHDVPPRPHPDDRPPKYQEHPDGQNARRPERPPPPRFSESHNTEVKVPLDSSQQVNGSRRSHHSPRKDSDKSRRSPQGEQDSHRSHSERHSEDRRRRGSADELEQRAPHRSYSERPRHGHHHDGRDSRGHTPRSHPNERLTREREYDRRSPQSHNGSGERRHDDRKERRWRDEPGRDPASRNGPVPKPRLGHSQQGPEMGNKARR